MPKPINPHLSDYLAENVKAGVIDFRLRAQIDTEGNVEFYIHPLGKDGATADYLAAPGKPDVWNKAGLNALIELAMRGR